MSLLRALNSSLKSVYPFVGTPASHHEAHDFDRPIPKTADIRRRQFAATVGWSLILAALLSSPNHAATINYGNFNVPGTGISFQGVRESSATDAVPLYGAPDPFNLGLDFDPPSFVSTSSGGAADVTDGQLNFTVKGVANASGSVGVSAISLSEAGDYTLAGAGGPPTSVLAGAIIRATVTEINGVAVSPLGLIPVNASFGDSLPGPVVVAPWSLGTLLNVAAQLAGLGYPAGTQATKVEVVIDNQLVSTSEPGTVAYIAKKDFRINLITDVVGNPIPEPGTLLLTAFAVCGVAVARRRNRR